MRARLSLIRAPGDWLCAAESRKRSSGRAMSACPIACPVRLQHGDQGDPASCPSYPAMIEPTTGFASRASNMRSGWTRVLGCLQQRHSNSCHPGMRFFIARQPRQSARFDSNDSRIRFSMTDDPSTNGASAAYSENSFTPTRPTTTNMTEQRRARFALSPKNAMPTIAVPTVAIPAKPA